MEPSRRAKCAQINLETFQKQVRQPIARQRRLSRHAILGKKRKKNRKKGEKEKADSDVNTQKASKKSTVTG